MKRALTGLIPAPVRLWLGRLADVFPPTGRGLLLASLAALSLAFYGFDELDLLLYVIGISGLVLLVLSSLLIAAVALFLRRHLHRHGAALPPRRLEAGAAQRTGFEMPALGFLPLVQLRWEWTEPGGVEVRLRPREKRFREEAMPRRRGQTTRLVRRFLVEDAFGLARVAWRDAKPATITVLPHPGRLRNAQLVQSMSSDEGIPHPSGAPEGDRMEIRRYHPGDSMRHILWKTYARTRQLNVRIPELAIERSRRTVAYLITGEDDEAAAAAARVALETGALGEDWLFGADGSPDPTADLEAALQAIARSGSLPKTADPRGDLGAFLHEAVRLGEARCIVFAPPRPGPWIEDVRRAAGVVGGGNVQGRISFVLGTDGIVFESARRPWWRRLLFAEPPTPGVPREELGDLLVQLASLGPALVADRPSGRSYSPEQQQSLYRPAAPRRASRPRLSGATG